MEFNKLTDILKQKNIINDITNVYNFNKIIANKFYDFITKYEEQVKNYL